MTQQSFDRLTTCIRQRWTNVHGVVVTMKKGSESESALRICCGNVRNDGFLAATCVVWCDETKVYEGALCSKELRKLLTNYKACHGQIRDSRQVEQDRQGSFLCLGTIGKCKKHCSMNKK